MCSHSYLISFHALFFREDNEKRISEKKNLMMVKLSPFLTVYSK